MHIELATYQQALCMVFCLKIVLAGSNVDLLVAGRGVFNAIFGAQAQNEINIVYGEVHRPLLTSHPVLAFTERTWAEYVYYSLNSSINAPKPCTISPSRSLQSSTPILTLNRSGETVASLIVRHSIRLSTPPRLVA